jgi:hypothetical protein
MTGRRRDVEVHLLEPGDYGKTNDFWYAATPNGLLANLAAHQVSEHEDGAITVSPSILVRNSVSSWHGYLERGVWRSV